MSDYLLALSDEWDRKPDRCRCGHPWDRHVEMAGCLDLARAGECAERALCPCWRESAEDWL